MAKRIDKGDAIRPAGDGEDHIGRPLKNTKARLRVTDAYELFGRRVVDVVVIKPGGIWGPPGRRTLECDPSAFVAVNDVPPKRAA